MNTHYAGGVNNYLNNNHMKYLAPFCGRFFVFWKISAANLQILWHHPTNVSMKRLVCCKVYSVL